jgi:hypothetical protein
VRLILFIKFVSYRDSSKDVITDQNATTSWFLVIIRNRIAQDPLDDCCFKRGTASATTTTLRDPRRATLQYSRTSKSRSRPARVPQTGQVLTFDDYGFG